ncbi:MAG: transferase [Betaproteobacteria bacterium HGW-Betaproteobacteria-15]|nr:MAG: transferase [Betaproteobacteria bacterium HGW-Betaproteobacteria-15]
MKILNVIPSINPKGGGPVEGISKIGAELTRLGHVQEIVCLDAPEEPFVSIHPRKVHALGPSKGSYRYNSALVPWLKEHAKHYDAVIVNGLWQYNGLGTWLALADSEVPYYVFTHGMLDPWFKRTYPLKHLKKWIYWPWAEYRVLRDATAVIFTSEEERLLARQSFWLYRCKEAVTAYGTSVPPTDSNRLQELFLNQHPALRGKRLFLFLSRIHEKKGCDLLIQAFAQIAFGNPDLHLVMAGPDQTGWASKLKIQAVSLGIADRITWLGMLQGDEKWGAYYTAEVFCLPSHQENFGITVAEALACGKPVLISNKVNIWREIEADGAGIISEDTAQATSQGLQQWLALPTAEKAAMKLAAKNCFETRFRIDRVADSLIRILQKK